MSVVSSAGVVSHRNEIRLEKRQVDWSGLVAILLDLGEVGFRWMEVLGLLWEGVYM